MASERTRSRLSVRKSGGAIVFCAGVVLRFCRYWGVAAAGFLLPLLLFANAIASSQAEPPPFRVFYQGRENLVWRRLMLDPSTVATNEARDAQVAVFQGELPSPGPALEALKARVRGGMGLLIVLGRDVDAAALANLTDGAIQQTGVVDPPSGPRHGEESERIAAVIQYSGPPGDPIGRDVSWKSAVRVHERSLLKLAPNAAVMVNTLKSDPVAPGTPILVSMKLGSGTIYVLNVWLKQGDLAERERSYVRMLTGAHGAQNYDFQRFFFFNWLLYAMTRESAGITPVRFGSWVAAPLPGNKTTVALATFFLLMMAALIFGLVAARRYSIRHPEEVENLYRPSAAPLKPASVGAAALPAEIREAPAIEKVRGDPRWEAVGFHRPLSGYIYNYLLNIVVLIPFNFVTTFWLDRTFVNPFLEARGAATAVGQVMVFLAPLLDLGTSQAMVKYYAEYRVREPGRAMGFIQFFIWFHLIVGTLALAVLGWIGLFVMPNTNFAYLSWIVVLYTFVEFPAFNGIFFNLFRAFQRFDYAQLLILLYFAMRPMVMMLGAIFGRHWGLMHPAYGEGLGVVMGFAIGGIMGNQFLGLISMIFYHRVGFRLLTILLAHFNWDTIRKSVVYGLKLTLGTVMPFLSWGAVPFIMGALLPNFLELNEIWFLVFSLSFAYLETGVYIFLTLMPSISESYSQGMKTLTQRYLDQGMRWGLIGTMMMGGAYIAFSDAFIRGLLPPQFGRAVEVLALIHIFRSVDFFVRMPDQVFQAVGKTGTFTIAAIIEHAGRMVLVYVFIKWFGFPGLFYGFAISAAVKALVVWPIMARYVVRPVFSIWQTFVNPALAAVGNYLILRGVVHALWTGPGHTANTWLVVGITLVGSLPVYLILSGLLGWDEFELNDLKDAADLVPAPFGALAQLS